MRTTRERSSAHGFTLIELMIVVAIIGVLATLAIAGVSKYISNAKAAEARSNVGQIATLAIVAIHSPKALDINTANNDPAAVNAGTVRAAAAGGAGAGCVHDQAGFTPARDQIANGQKAYGNWNVAPWNCLKFGLDRATPFGYRYHKANNAQKFTALAAPGDQSGLPSFRIEGAYNGNVNDWVVGEMEEDPTGAEPAVR